MDLRIKNSSDNDFIIPLLEEKLGGVELPYLHVKKGGKTWHAPFIKNTDTIELYKSELVIMHLKYKETKYVMLRDLNYIGVAILKDNKLHLTTKLNRNGKTVIINKAEPLILYKVIRENGIKKYTPVMDVNYDDVLYIDREDVYHDVRILNLTQNKLIVKSSPFILKRKKE